MGGPSGRDVRLKPPIFLAVLHISCGRPASLVWAGMTAHSLLGAAVVANLGVTRASHLPPPPAPPAVELLSA